MHQCEYNTITIKFDSFYISDNFNNIENESFLSDIANISDKYIQLKVCKICHAIKLPEKVSVTPEPEPVEYLTDYIDTFLVYAKTNEQHHANAILKRLSVRISPYDYSALLQSYMSFIPLNIKGIPFPEFYDVVDTVRKRYIGIEYQPYIV